jgi:hypothetical protein
MRLQTLLLTLLVTCAALLLPVVVDGSGLAVVSASAAMLCAFTIAALAAPAANHRTAVVTVPVSQRLHGRFLQQSRPGVPGRTRARAPGCGR